MTRCLQALTAVAVVLAAAAAASPLTDMERDIIRVSEGIVELFGRHSDDIWPGYDLSEQPFLVYIPGQFALLMNCGDGADGFEPYPGDWPALRGQVCCSRGQVGNLVGQLAFGFDAGGVTTVAVGFPDSLPPSFDDLELKMLGYIVHEAFHEYQSAAFGETEWAREQMYPIEDAENAALACLEMVLLSDAVQAAWAGDDDRVRRSTGQFVAVRDHRWDRADSFVETFERGKETTEGTARYVELRCLDLARGLDYESSVPGADPLGVNLKHAAMPGSLLDNFRGSMLDGAVPVEDLPRNRIYPVASAQAFLLDYLEVDWKQEVERSTSDFTYARLLRSGLALDEERYAELLEEAKTRYDYPGLLAAAARAIAGHRSSYEEALASFEDRGGTRIAIRFDANGLGRSRSTSATRLVVDRGSRELCGHYDVYTLERDGTFFELHDSGLLEENDYDGHGKTVVFRSPVVEAMAVDGNALAPDVARSATFTSIEIVGEGFELKHDGPGSVEVGEGNIVVDLIPR